jgi:hypothetical protein
MRFPESLPLNIAEISDPRDRMGRLPIYSESIYDCQFASNDRVSNKSGDDLAQNGKEK